MHTLDVNYILATYSGLLATGCGAKDKKLIETESELVQDQGTSQICVYNDAFTAKGKKVIIPLSIS